MQLLIFYFNYLRCLTKMKIRKQNEVVYSFVYLLLSKNMFQFATELLQLVTITF